MRRPLCDGQHPLQRFVDGKGGARIEQRLQAIVVDIPLNTLQYSSVKIPFRSFHISSGAVQVTERTQKIPKKYCCVIAGVTGGCNAGEV